MLATVIIFINFLTQGRMSTCIFTANRRLQVDQSRFLRIFPDKLTANESIIELFHLDVLWEKTGSWPQVELQTNQVSDKAV